MEKIKAAFGALLAPFSKAINAVKDGYLKAVDWVVAHPHKTILASAGAIVLLAVL